VIKSAGILAAAAPLLAALAAGAGCSGVPRIEIDGPEARLSPALVGVCSVSMKIANKGNGTDRLIRASVDVPGAVAEIHEIRNGKMVRSDGIRIPAGGSLVLGPGGPHIMVLNLPGDAGVGRELTLRLVFEWSGERQTSVRISG
jgi:copper(I)-binding protein